MKKLLVIVMLVTCVATAFSQPKTSKNNYTGAWENNASWTTSPAPDGTVNTELDLTINGYITRNGNLAVQGSYLTQNFVINDTLVVLGNLDFRNNAAELVIGPNGVLIVIGSVTFGNNTIITNDGIFAVSGSIDFAPGASDIYAGSGELFVQGTVDDNVVAQTADNWDNLDTLYPKIYEFIQCGGGSSCVLPIKLAYFEVALRNETVELRWATIMEENFLKFVVQRSANGLDFEDIGEVAGKGFDIYDIVSKYSFTDDAPLLGKNYYRLKAVDIDDSFEHFAVKLVELKGLKKLAVYPNPSSGSAINFTTNFNPSESDRIVLTNQLGVEIFSASASATNNSISFADKLRPGIYMLRYVAGDYEQTARIFVKN